MPIKTKTESPPPEVYVEGLKITARQTTSSVLPEDMQEVAKLGKIVKDENNSKRGVVIRVTEAIQNLDKEPK